MIHIQSRIDDAICLETVRTLLPKDKVEAVETKGDTADADASRANVDVVPSQMRVMMFMQYTSTPWKAFDPC
jgi:hypothetical protein